MRSEAAVLPGGSRNGKIQKTRLATKNGFASSATPQPCHSMSGTATIPNTHSGTSTRRSRCPITSTSGSCCAERDIIEPPIPNSTPHAGNSAR